MSPGALRLAGAVNVAPGRDVAEVYVVGGRFTFERPRHSGDIDTLEGVVLPGLVDVHCHVGVAPGGGGADEGLAEKQAIAERDAGVLLLRDAGSPVDTRWIDARDDLPRIVRAGQFIARPKRYLRYYARELEDVQDLPSAVAEEAQRGDGWVKLIADWIDRDLGAGADLTPLWPADVLAAAVAEAHTLGARVTAHTFAHEAIDPLLDAGIDCLEHGTGMDEAQIATAAERGIPVVPTLLQIAQFETIAAQADGKYPVYAARMRAMHRRRHAHAHHLFEAGVPLLVGTDAGGTIAHGSIAAEAAEMVAAGIPDEAVVDAATHSARGFLGVPGIEEGAPASAVVFAADPRTNIAALGDPHAIVLGTRAFSPRPG